MVRVKDNKMYVVRRSARLFIYTQARYSVQKENHMSRTTIFDITADSPPPKGLPLVDIDAAPLL